jgi:uncharacterized protein YqjF (DUF2071 family)
MRLATDRDKTAGLDKTAGRDEEAGLDEISYACRRRWPGPRGAVCRVRVRVGDPYRAGELGDRDHFLTARWILFSIHGSRHRFARAQHRPWPLYRAEALAVDDRLVPAAGLPPPQGEPLVHYSPGVDVRIGRPESYG